MKYLILLAIYLNTPFHSFGQKNIFSFNKTQFELNGKPFQIISGEMHPARIPKTYWRHRIQMTKAMGCNTVAAYFFWNYFETSEGVFDFSTENRNIREFLQICKEENMWVLARPGPYVCAEWDFGGLPSYLLKYPDIKIRCMDPRYMQAVEKYINALCKEIKGLQCIYGGPVMMLQIENEYGSYGNDRNYIKALKKMWRDNGIQIPFFTADGATPYMLEAGSLEDCAIGLDSGSEDADFMIAGNHNPNVPVFSSETYPGWLTHWFEKWQRPDTNALKKEVTYLLKTNRSFNLYVIHGGTNFGFTAGANAFNSNQFQPDVTSYDYDAPINENGAPTPKYFMLRRLIQQYTGAKLAALPEPIKKISIPSFPLYKINSIWQHLPQPILSPQPIPFEYFNQNQGVAIYKTTLVGHHSGKLKIWEPHDYALVFLDGKLIDTVYRDGGKWEVELPKTTSLNPVLEIMVEGMGHINFAQFMTDRKGITDRVTLNGMTLMNWEIYPIPFDHDYLQEKSNALRGMVDEKNGVFFKGHFNLTETGDTYLDLSHFKKGFVLVNGHHIGRHWYVGPQERLYCPAVFLNKGHNDIVVFDFWQMEPATVEGKTEMNY
jgi:beta-galactosidase